MNKYTTVLNSFTQNIEIIILKWRLNIHTNRDARDISQEGRRLGLNKKKFHTDEVKSVQNLQLLVKVVITLFMNDKQKTNVSRV